MRKSSYVLRNLSPETRSIEGDPVRSDPIILSIKDDRKPIDNTGLGDSDWRSETTGVLALGSVIYSQPSETSFRLTWQGSQAVFATCTQS